MTYDYERHGTTTLFAALDVLEGTVLGRCIQRHRHQEFIRFDRRSRAHARRHQTRETSAAVPVPIADHGGVTAVPSTGVASGKRP